MKRIRLRLEKRRKVKKRMGRMKKSKYNEIFGKGIEFLPQTLINPFLCNKY